MIVYLNTVNHTGILMKIGVVFAVGEITIVS